MLLLNGNIDFLQAPLLFFLLYSLRECMFTISKLLKTLFSSICPNLIFSGASQVELQVKNLPENAGHLRDASSISGLERSPGGGHGNPLWYSCLENPMDRVHRVAELDMTEAP